MITSTSIVEFTNVRPIPICQSKNNYAPLYFTQVIGACGSPEKCEIVKSKGAIAAIDYNKESLKDKVKELTGGKGANIILDAVGGDIFDQCLRW